MTHSPNLNKTPVRFDRIAGLISERFYATTKLKHAMVESVSEPSIAARVEVADRDSGAGTTDEVKAKMFAPCFTLRRGAGLGFRPRRCVVITQPGETIEVSTGTDAPSARTAA